jgi:DNA-binding NtrC family response regulator
MVVCSDLSYAPRAQLDCDGWLVIWARDAKNAIAKVRSERFDLAVLVSTGVEMDITETLFNLRDIHHSMPIAVVQPSSDLKDTPSSAAYLPTDHNLIAVQGLDELVRIMQRHRSSIVSQPSRDRPQSNDGRASRSQVALHSPDSNTRSRD